MRPWGKIRRPIAALALLTGLLSSMAGAEAPVKLSPDELRATAVQALRIGAPEQAYSYAQALLQRDPADRQALLVHSRAARTLGRFDEARSSAQQAWRLSETDEQKFASSMVMAQALASDERRTLAQWWLRRAVEHAPSEELNRIAVRDFRYVRARNPWLTRLSFAITPDSNINNGSSQRSSFLNYKLSEVLYGQPVEYQLGGSARALSGIEYALGVTTRYRFRELPTRAHDLILSVDLRAYSLSSEAKAIAPTASASDFSFASYTLGYGQRGINLDRRGEYRFFVDVGQSWYGGNEYARFARFSLGQSYKLARGRQINARIATERQWGVTRSDQDTVRADLSYTLPLSGGTVLWTNLTGAVATSDVAADEFDEIALRAQITFAKPVFGATAQLGLWARSRDYDVSPHDRNGRQEDKYEADFTLIFNKIDYYGFNPTMRISASRTESNIALYDARRFGVNFGIQSAF